MKHFRDFKIPRFKTKNKKNTHPSHYYNVPLYYHRDRAESNVPLQKTSTKYRKEPKLSQRYLRTIPLGEGMKPKETGYPEDDQGKDYVESVLHTSSSHNPFLCHLGTTSKSTENYAPLIIMPIKIKTSEHRSSYHMPRPNLIRS
jgi:hypothetical protein